MHASHTARSTLKLACGFELPRYDVQDTGSRARKMDSWFRVAVRARLDVRRRTSVIGYQVRNLHAEAQKTKRLACLWDPRVPGMLYGYAHLASMSNRGRWAQGQAKV
jgi:hypothetical protein